MKAQMRIIDNKKVCITDDEFRFYNNLCREYDRPNFKGESLFVDHFESDDDGIIVFVKPPSKRYSSLEVYTFIVSLMVNQHLRVMREQTESFVKEAKAAHIKMLEDMEKKKNELDEKFDKLQKSLVEGNR
jgi:hypothetical protein